MKFTTTENKTFRGHLGYVPKQWICDEFENHKDSIWKYFVKNIKLYDWDICGTEIHDFLFQDGKAFRLEYSWWSEWNNDDEEENGLKDEVLIHEISSEDANVPDKKIRDWL
jgi:hypothetical protein